MLGPGQSYGSSVSNPISASSAPGVSPERVSAAPAPPMLGSDAVLDETVPAFGEHSEDHAQAAQSAPGLMAPRRSSTMSAHQRRRTSSMSFSRFFRRSDASARGAEFDEHLGGDDFLGEDGRRATMTVQEVDREEQTLKKMEAHDEEYNQTGQSLYEIRKQEQYSSVPNRARPDDYLAAVDSDRQRRQSKAARKSEKRASREERKSERQIRRGKADPVVRTIERGTVDYAVSDAKRIGVLNLAKMHLAAVPDNVFDDLPGTTRLINVSENNLTAIDTRFTEFVLVQRFIANDNSISTVPSVISRMTALRKIDLANNQLTALPESFTAMPHLEHIDLSSNGLSTLPDSFASLNLISLRLSNNNFTAAPRVIEAMRSLQEIYLDNNKIVAVPATWAALTLLFKLALDVNHIADFPDEILERCTELHNLSIRGNPLTAARLESKPSWNAYQSRRLLFHKYRLDQGTVTMDELRITDQ